MEIKSGFRTTEFWMSLIGPLVGLLVLFGVISAEEADTLTEAIIAAVLALAALYAAVKPILDYIRSRTQVKVAQALGNNPEAIRAFNVAYDQE